MHLLSTGLVWISTDIIISFPHPRDGSFALQGEAGWQGCSSDRTGLPFSTISINDGWGKHPFLYFTSDIHWNIAWLFVSDSFVPNKRNGLLVWNCNRFMALTPIYDGVNYVEFLFLGWELQKTLSVEVPVKVLYTEGLQIWIPCMGKVLPSCSFWRINSLHGCLNECTHSRANALQYRFQLPDP